MSTPAAASPLADLASLQDAYLWVLDQELRVVGATPAVADALAVSLDQLRGQRAGDLYKRSGPAELTIAKRRAALQAVLTTGVPDTTMYWDWLPGQGRVAYIIITVVRFAPDRLLLVGHDITASQAPLTAWLQTPGVQNIAMMVQTPAGHLLGITEAMARLLGWPDAASATGASLENSPFATEARRGLALAEAAAPMPSTQIELGLDLQGRLIRYAVTRAMMPASPCPGAAQAPQADGCPACGPLMLTIALDLTDEPTVALPASRAALGLPPRQFEVLLALWAKEPRGRTARRLSISVATVDWHRQALKTRFGVDTTGALLDAVRADELLRALLDALVSGQGRGLGLGKT